MKSIKGNSEAMAKGIMARLHHYSSTEQYCPEGETSWRKFHVGKYSGGHTNKSVKDPMPNVLKEVIPLVFERLGNQKFLECCKSNS